MNSRPMCPPNDVTGIAKWSKFLNCPHLPLCPLKVCGKRNISETIVEILIKVILMVITVWGCSKCCLGPSRYESTSCKAKCRIKQITLSSN